MFDRYDIINEEDLAVAMATRYGTIGDRRSKPGLANFSSANP